MYQVKEVIASQHILVLCGSPATGKSLSPLLKTKLSFLIVDAVNPDTVSVWEDDEKS